MNLSFYTIDDLRLGPNLWTETRFDAVQDILTHHRNLPGDTVKELGLMNGARKLPLIRRVCLPADRTLKTSLLRTAWPSPPGGGPRRCWRRHGNVSPP